jgi:hypothetical protein
MFAPRGSKSTALALDLWAVGIAFGFLFLVVAGVLPRFPG